MTSASAEPVHCTELVPGAELMAAVISVAGTAECVGRSGQGPSTLRLMADIEDLGSWSWR
jgi:hypothetical protein